MKRHQSLIALSHDHHHGLMLAQLIKKGAPEYKGLPTDLIGKVKYAKEAWEKELKIHFKNEEKILFPFVKDRDAELDQLIEDILEEHKKIKGLVKSLDTSENKEEVLNDLGVLLEKHIRKEERKVFQKIQLLFKDKLNELNGKIISVKDSCST
jgi:iron-sulfur cluster repair protein YtfE (RIC family)